MTQKKKDNVADLTLEILRDIRDEAKKTNSRIDETNSRLDETNMRLGDTNSRIDETNMRLGDTNTRLDGLCGEMRRGFATLGQRLDNVLLGEHRDEHQSLHSRVSRLEEHLGLEPASGK
jgi:hypothetical protein